MTAQKIYEFSGTTKQELLILEKYLQKKDYSKDTIYQYYNYAGLFVEYLTEQDIEPELVNYPVIKDFIFQLKKDKSIRHINRILTGIKHYYASLRIGINPAADLRIRGERRGMQHHFIELEELEEVYRNYLGLDERTKRNKAILGLLVYQGLTTRELHQLEEKNIKLREGKIYIKGSKNSNGRTLNLEACQLLDLQEYLLMVRPRMLENLETGKYREKSGRKPKSIDPKIYEQVFFSEGGSANIKTSLYHMFRAIEKLNPVLTSGKIIRAAVISNWLKRYDIRIVQYMAGHRYVSSTEKYDIMNLEELMEGMENFHPLK